MTSPELVRVSMGPLFHFQVGGTGLLEVQAGRAWKTWGGFVLSATAHPLTPGRGRGRGRGSSRPGYWQTVSSPNVNASSDQGSSYIILNRQFSVIRSDDIIPDK